MARPVLIIEFSHRAARAAVFTASSQSAYFSMPSDGKGVADLARAVVKAVAEKERVDASSCDVFVSVPVSTVALRVVDVPMNDRTGINEILPFELAGALAIDPGETVIDNIPLGGGKALAVALEKKVLSEYIDAFRALNADPVWIGVAGLSVSRLLSGLYDTPGAKAFVSADYISVFEGPNPLFFSAYSGRAGLKLALSYLEAEGVSMGEVYLSDVKGDDLNGFFPGARMSAVTLPDGLPPEAAGLAAVSFAIKKGLLAETVNLRKGEFENTREKTAFRKKARVTLVLLVLIAVLAVGDAYVRYMIRDKELGAYKKALRGAYTNLFPGEKPPADELYQLSIKVKAIDKEVSVLNAGPGVLDIMNLIAAAASKDPSLSVRIQEMGVADGKLRASGEAASFEAANKFKDLLAAGNHFKNIQLTELKSKTGGRASFSLSMSVI
jgi:type II secretory pathway component PulL